MGLVGTLTTVAPEVGRGASTDAMDATYLQAAMEAKRATIGTVSGQGAIRGGFVFGGNNYVFRDKTGGADCGMYKATTAGFVSVDLGHELEYETGANAVVVGDTIIGASSGATAVVTAVSLVGGTWAGGDATGDLHFTSHTGDFLVGENITSLRLTPTVHAVVASARQNETIDPGGRIEAIVHNFYGATNQVKAYAVTGVSSAFSYDGTAYVPIYTGMAVDTPNHIQEHRNYLFLAFPGGSVQHSSATDPTSFSAVLGASELGLGDENTGMVPVVGGQMALFTRNMTYILSGKNASEWDLSRHDRGAGALDWSVQKMASPVYMDDRGVTTLDAVQEFGDFADNVISELVQPYVEARKLTITASIRVKSKTQYRIFFSDKTALCFSFKNRRLIGVTPFEYDHIVRAAWSGEDADGNELLFFGSDDGYVYRMDSGNNFDGSAITAAGRLPFHHYGSPNHYKRFLKATLELKAAGPGSLSVFPDFTYSDTDAPDAIAQSFTLAGGGNFWDIGTWEAMYWDATPIGEAEQYIDGYGRNMGLLWTHSSTYEEPHTIHGVRVEFSVKARRR